MVGRNLRIEPKTSDAVERACSQKVYTSYKQSDPLLFELLGALQT